VIIYLDTNVFGRPFDDRSYLRIDIEAQASLAILAMIEEKQMKCLCSDILRLEVAQTPMPKRMRIQSLITLCSTYVYETDVLEKMALKISRKTRIKPRDALHIASACLGKVEYFITCDNGVIRKANKIEKDLKGLGYNIKICGILDFIEEIKE
jgi:predicted nucleic acid-binding protein